MGREPRYFKGYADFLGPRGAGLCSPPAQAMLNAVLVQYDGRNNGSMKLSASVLSPIWGSSDRRTKAKRELLEYAFIFEVKRGFQKSVDTPNGRIGSARQKIASLYAVACFPLDHNPQHDPDLVAKFDPDLWRIRIAENPPTSPRKRKREAPNNAEDGIDEKKSQCRGRHCGSETIPSTALRDPQQCRGRHETPIPTMPPTCHLVDVYPSSGVSSGGVGAEVSR